MRVLFIGDIVGNPGRKAAKEMIPVIKKERLIDCCMANCENAAGGTGITYIVAKELHSMGIDALTMGNHVWAKKEVLNFIDSEPWIVRPANYPQELPGKGSTVIDAGKSKVGVINIMGRVFMDSIDCPFKAALREIDYVRSFARVVIVDMHAETTSEKHALAWYLDGKVSCVFGTHTHVQTSDEKIFPCGTGYITDVGMTGPYEGILGVDREIIINKFLNHMPVKFEVAKGKVQFNAVIADIDEKNGMTVKIERISRVFDLKS